MYWVETYYFHDYTDFLNNPYYLGQIVALKTIRVIKSIGVLFNNISKFETAKDLMTQLTESYSWWIQKIELSIPRFHCHQVTSLYSLPSFIWNVCPCA